MNEVTKGRPIKTDPVKVAAWRQARKASVPETATRFGLSASTVKRYCRDHGEEAATARANWRIQRVIAEADHLDYSAKIAEITLRWAHEAHEAFRLDPSWENLFIALTHAQRLVPKENRNKKPGDW